MESTMARSISKGSVAAVAGIPIEFRIEHSVRVDLCVIPEKDAVDLRAQISLSPARRVRARIVEEDEELADADRAFLSAQFREVRQMGSEVRRYSHSPPSRSEKAGDRLNI
jgi:hypothetical protein